MKLMPASSTALSRAAASLSLDAVAQLHGAEAEGGDLQAGAAEGALGEVGHE